MVAVGGGAGGVAAAVVAAAADAAVVAAAVVVGCFLFPDATNGDVERTACFLFQHAY